MRTGVYVVVLAVSVSSLAQRSESARKSFENAVPAKLRASFCSVLQRGVTTQLSGDGKALYEVLRPEILAGWTKTSFVESLQQPGDKPSEFLVAEVKASQTSGNQTNWKVFGCHVLRDDANNFSDPARTTIYLENGQWFTDYLETTIVLDGSNKCPSLRTQCLFLHSAGE